MVASSNDSIGLFEAISTTRAIRDFRPDPVPDDLLRRVLELAGQAPSGGNRQPWRWVIIRSTEGKRKVSELVRQASQRAAQAATSGQTLTTPASSSAAGSDDFANMLLGVPVIVIVCARRPASEGPWSVGPFGQTYPAVQNLLLAARGLGLGGTITTNFRWMMDEFRIYLRLPDEIEPTCLIPLGYPLGAGRNQHGTKSRQPLEELAYEEHWGQAVAF